MDKLPIYLSREDYDVITREHGWDATLDIMFKIAYIADCNPYIANMFLDDLKPIKKEVSNEKQTQTLPNSSRVSWQKSPQN